MVETYVNFDGERKLHIGGKASASGWEIINAVPADYVDHVGNAKDLSRFSSNCFAAVYASHVLEHFDYKDDLIIALREWHRVLKPGGRLYISVPDLEILCRIFLEKKQCNFAERFMVMRMMFGGHVDEYDYHVVGLDEDIARYFLQEAGFVDVQRVKTFNIFADTSDMKFKGVMISLNLIAVKENRS